MCARSDCIKLKSAQLPKFTDVVLDLAAVNNIDKIYYSRSEFPTTLLNQHDLGTYLASSKINDIINNFLLEDGLSNNVSIVSTRFFVDIKKRKASLEIMNHFSSDSRTEKRIICIPVHKNENRWFLIAIFPKSHVIYSADSLGRCNTSDLDVVADYLKKYLTFYKKEFYAEQWWNILGFKDKKNAVDCGVYMLINIHCLIHDSFPEEGYHDIYLRYWIASKTLTALDNSRWYSENRPSEEQAKVIASINDLPKDIGCQLKQFKSICNHIDRRQFALDDGTLLSDKESEDSLEEPDVSK